MCKIPNAQKEATAQIDIPPVSLTGIIPFHAITSSNLVNSLPHLMNEAPYLTASGQLLSGSSVVQVQIKSGYIRPAQSLMRSLRMIKLFCLALRKASSFHSLCS